MDPEPSQAAANPGGSTLPVAPGGPPVPGGQSATLADAELSTLREENKKKNAEAAALRKRLDALETAERERQAASLSELERAHTRAAEMEARAAAAEQTARTTRLELFLAGKGARHVTLLVKDVRPADVEWDADGQVTNGDALLGKLRKAYPDLFAPVPAAAAPPPPAPGAPTNPATGAGNGGAPRVSFARIPDWTEVLGPGGAPK